MTSDDKFSVTLTIVDGTSRDRQLDAAVASALPSALSSKRHGILVTRHSTKRFTVAVSESVPYGEIRERRNW